jgi:hypothetical protein
MSSRTNSFSGDLLLIAIASPKLSRVAKLFLVIAEKHLSLKDWLHSKTWSQSWRSPAKRSFTCFKQNVSPKASYRLISKVGLRKILTAIRMKWIQFPILDSNISQGIFCTSSLLSFSTPKFFKLDSKAEARASLQKKKRICFSKPLSSLGNRTATA